MEDWYKLDNAAKLFPSVTNSKNTSVFRVTAILVNSVKKEVLQRAVDQTVERYPMLFIKMRQGLFWNYFDSNHVKFHVEEEQTPPCSMIIPSRNNGYFLKVLYSGHRVSVEVFHVLTDGSGAIEFLKSVLFYYFSHLGHDIDSQGKILLSDGYVPPDNMEDSFNAYYEELKSNLQVEPQNEPTAYHITGTAFAQHGNNVTTGVMSASELNKIAKAKGVTITAYLIAVTIYSIYMTRNHYTGKMAPIVITVPVNLRKIFPSATLRNFFGIVNVGMTMKRDIAFDEIVQSVSGQLKEKITRESLQQSIFKNVLLEKRLYSKLTPLWVKNRFVNAGFHLMGESKKTLSLSNLGNIALPEGMSKLIHHMEGITYPTAKGPINIGICSANDKLAISFSRMVKGKDLQRYFFRFLSGEEGVDLAVYSNDWGEL